MDRNAFNNAFTTSVAVGQQAWTAPGTYQFVVPPNCYSLSALCVGAGASSTRTLGGSGGDLRYAKVIAVTPGETLTVVVGKGGIRQAQTDTAVAGTSTRLLRGSTVLLVAIGGDSGLVSTPASSNVGGGSGGVAALGGGGAGGYSGAGGAGNGSPAVANSGGGGGGAEGNSSQGSGAGGGTGLKGQGATGAGGVARSGGGGGSGGQAGGAGIGNFAGNGGIAGGGGGASPNDQGGDGADGAARLIWPAPIRSYPSTLTQDM